ncbi:MAG: hypothetical protein FWE40_01710 [Oscillospiraceae bacterium]|jgi:hypothetical protein|nr:hypothetical protein [Oscillospiraceae bacterium]
MQNVVGKKSLAGFIITVVANVVLDLLVLWNWGLGIMFFAFVGITVFFVVSGVLELRKTISADHNGVMVNGVLIPYASVGTMEVKNSVWQKNVSLVTMEGATYRVNVTNPEEVANVVMANKAIVVGQMPQQF